MGNACVERPVHVVIVCGLAPDPLRIGIGDGYLEACAFLARAGHARFDCITPFPSVTPTGVTSIVTGLAPCEHGILGKAWYERDRRRVHEFDPERDLATPTAPVLAARILQAGGRLCTVNVPSACGGTGAGVGASDQVAAARTVGAIVRREADVTFTLLRDPDRVGHEVGPSLTLPALWRADRAIGQILKAYGSWDTAVAEARWILVGDHGLSGLYPDRPGHALVPADLLGGRADCAIVPNDRAAFVTLLDPTAADRRDRLIEEIALRPGIEQVLWHEAGWGHARHGDLEFAWRPGPGFKDRRGRSWRISGSPAALGLEIVADTLAESDFPDPLRRVEDLLSAPGAPDLAITAQEGYEFAPQARACGSHGSLSTQDSRVPLITAGLPPTGPEPRSQEVATLVAEAIGLGRLVTA